MRRPWTVLIGAVAVLLVLGAIGANVTERLKPTLLSVEGTESARGNALLTRHFGDSAPFAILLEGPPAEIDRQGPELVAALRRRPTVTTLSPWDRGAGVARLRRSPDTALIIANFHVPEDVAVEETVPEVDRLLGAEVAPPVTAIVASYPGVAREIQEDTIEATRQAELIVAPVLLLVLLLVFRSPIAAAIPLLFGAMTVIAARGLMSLATGAIDMSGFALGVASMLGLALGVDYALLMVSRFREELAAGASPARAASVTRMTAGRTTIFAGSTLLMAMLIVALLVPGALLLSLCATVIGVIVLAVAGPAVVGPAVLVLLGENVNRWRIGGDRQPGAAWSTVSRGALRRPRTAIAAISVLLLLIALPALGLATGSPSLEELSPGNSVRQDVEAIEAAVGGGWISPSIVVASVERGSMTEPRRLNALSRWQANEASDPDVEAVVGPGSLARRVAPLRAAGRGLLGEAGGNPRLIGMTRDLDRASDGVVRLRDGLGRAAEGALLLADGSGRAHWGADLLADGLTRATSGGRGASSSLARFQRGAELAVTGGAAALLGTSVLEFGIEELDSDARLAIAEGADLEAGMGEARESLPAAAAAAAETEAELASAWRELEAMSVGASDPRYPALAEAVRRALTAATGTDPVDGASYAQGYEGLSAALATVDDRLEAGLAESGSLARRLERIRRGLQGLGDVVSRLEGALEKLAGGTERLADGSDLIVEGAGRLGAGLVRLRNGASRLSDGLARLQDGNETLARGLSYAYRRTRPLATGARAAEAAVRSGRAELRSRSPGFFDSGYFVLSALDGAPTGPRRLAGQAVDLDAGGQAAQILVVTRFPVNAPDLAEFNDRLRLSAARLGDRIGAEVAVTGGAAQLTDYDRATRARIPLLMAMTTLATLLALIAILRAVPLAIIAVFLNLLTAAAAFGVLRLVFEIPDGLPFSGASYIDAVSAACLFGVVFGLSIDYSVFVLMRMRESWDRDGDSEAAIVEGLARTAGVITGAAAIMAAIFLVFGISPVATVAQFGLALTVAVLLDATVIRLMLMPALMKLVGPRVWWLPSWLDRRLPRFGAH